MKHFHAERLSHLNILIVHVLGFEIIVCRRFHDIASLSLKIHHKWIRKRKDVYYDKEMRLFSRNERKVQFPFNKILQNCSNLRHFDSSAFDRIRWNPSRLPKKLNLQRLTLTGNYH